MHFAICDVDEGGDIAVQIEQCVHFDGGPAAEPRPRKQAPAQVVGGRVQRVKTLIQHHTERIGGIQRSCDGDQHLRKVGPDALVVRVIGVGQRGTCHATAKTHVVQLATHRPQAGLDVAQPLAAGQLREGHRQSAALIYFSRIPAE